MPNDPDGESLHNRGLVLDLLQGQGRPRYLLEARWAPAATSNVDKACFLPKTDRVPPCEI